MPQPIYKVLTNSDWLRALATDVVEAPVDVQDGYVHFSTASTLQATLDKWFRGAASAVLLAFDAEQFGNDLRWEIARGDELFPHVYARVSARQATRVWALELGPNGAPLAPEGLRRPYALAPLNS